MDNNHIILNQSKDSIGSTHAVERSGGASTKSVVSAMEPAKDDGTCCPDQSVIEIKQEIPEIDLVLDLGDDDDDGPKDNLLAKGDFGVKVEPHWLKTYEVCEEVAEGDPVQSAGNVKKESAEETAGANDPTKTGRRTEANVMDTLILEIDNTDNLDVCLDRGKAKVAKAEGGRVVKNHATIGKVAQENSALILADCAVNLKKIDEDVGQEEKTGRDEVTGEKQSDEVNPSNINNLSKKKAAYKQGGAKACLANPKTKTALVEKPSSQVQDKSDGGDGEECLRGKIKTVSECKSESATGDQNHKSQPSALTDKVKHAEKLDEIPSVQPSQSRPSYEAGAFKKFEPRFIWISNISKHTRASDLKLHLSAHGKVVTAKIVTDGKLYYGYVVMDRREDVSNCIRNLNETLFEGRKIRLSDEGPEKKIREGKGAIVKQEKVESPKDNRSDKIEAKARRWGDDCPCPPRRNKSRSNDPLTLKVSGRKERNLSEEMRRSEDLRRRNRELREQRERHKRDLEREREEHRRRRMKEEQYRQAELKLERERRDLEHERELLEKKRTELLQLQKKLTETERSMVSRQKVEMERNLRHIADDYGKKRRSPEEFGRKAKFARTEVEGMRCPPEGKDYWKNERNKHKSPLKSKAECFEMEPYTSKAMPREDKPCVAPPPPILSNPFDLSERRRREKEREWENRSTYEKKEVLVREMSKAFDRKVEYGFAPTSYRYKSGKYEKPQSSVVTTWDKFAPGLYKNAPGSWRSDAARPVQRHQSQSFPPGGGSSGGPQFGSTSSGVPHYYPHQPEYGRPSDFYGRPPARKY